MAEPPEIRISDLDRERTIETLTAAYGEGRLDMAEFEERVSLAQAAKIRADLVPLTRDLPANIDTPRLPARIMDKSWTTWFRKELGFFLVAPIICTVIWAMTDFGGYYWPMWVWLGCLSIVVIGIIEGRDGDSDDD